MIINDNQWYLTKLVGEIFLWYKYPCHVNDISRNYFKQQMFLTVKVIGLLMAHGQKTSSNSVVCWPAKMEDLTFCCQVCAKKFSTKKKLKNHSYTHQESHETCGECGELFSNKIKLRNHKRSHEVRSKEFSISKVDSLLI